MWATVPEECCVEPRFSLPAWDTVAVLAEQWDLQLSNESLPTPMLQVLRGTPGTVPRQALKDRRP